MRKSLYLSLLSLLGVILLAYGGALGNGYVWDDGFFLSGNVVLDGFKQVMQTVLQPLFGQQSYFRPIPLLMVYGESILSGRNAGLSHGVNLLVHFINCSLLLVLLRRAMGDLAVEGRAHWLVPLLLALMYAVHPALSEVVNWISARFDLMATLWMLLALWVWGEDRLSDLGRAVLVSLCFFLGALCKESLVVLPVVLVAYQVLRRSARSEDGRFRLSGVFTRRELVGYAGIILFGLVYLALRHQALEGAPPMAPQDFDPGQRAAFFLLALAKYIQLTLMPFSGISVQHSFYWTDYAGLSRHLPAIILSLLFLLLTAFGLVRRKSIALVAATWVASLLPVLHLLGISIGNNLVQERFLYFPVAVLLLLAPYGLARLQCSFALKRLACISAIGFVLVSVLLVKSIVPMWKDNRALWEWAVRTDPASRSAKENLLWIYAEQNMYSEARGQFEEIKKAGWRINGPVAINMAAVHYFEGDYRGALEMYQVALERRASLPPQYRSNLYAGMALQHALLGEDAQARDWIGQALEQSVVTQNAIGNFLVFCNDRTEQRERFSEAQLLRAQSSMNRVAELLEKNQPEKYRDGAFCPTPAGSGIDPVAAGQ